MLPWNKLPKDLQKAILAMIVMGGGTIACGRVGPMVCDPRRRRPPRACRRPGFMAIRRRRLPLRARRPACLSRHP